MPEDKKPLPKPPSTPFGRNKQFGDEGNPDSREELIADKMGMAMAGGKLDEFMDKEIGDNDNARKLASMMMGMSGMSSGGSTAQGSPGPSESVESPEPQKQQKQEEASAGAGPSTPAPEEMMKAAMSGDVKGLSQMLRNEHMKRQGADGNSPEETPADAGQEPAEAASPIEGDDEAQMEKQVLIKLMKIASVIDQTGHGKSRIYELMKDGSFPRLESSSDDLAVGPANHR